MQKAQLILPLTAILLLAGLASGLSAEPFKQGMTEYNAGNYVAAFKLFEQAAEQGHPSAQYQLGLMYIYGKGAAQNDKEAVKWMIKAANQGNTQAQYQLGLSYLNGRGIAWSALQAYKWLSLAAVDGDSNVNKMRDLVASELTQEQVAEAQKQAHNWKPKH